MFVIDDCQNLDQDSWKFLPHICCQGNIMIVASVKSSAGVEENTVALGTINSVRKYTYYPTLFIDYPTLFIELLFP